MGTERMQTCEKINIKTKKRIGKKKKKIRLAFQFTLEMQKKKPQKTKKKTIYTAFFKEYK